MRVMDLYWKKNKEWYYYDDNLMPRIKENAPKEAKESYKRYLEQNKKNVCH